MSCRLGQRHLLQVSATSSRLERLAGLSLRAGPIRSTSRNLTLLEITLTTMLQTSKQQLTTPTPIRDKESTARPEITKQPRRYFLMLPATFAAAWLSGRGR